MEALRERFGKYLVLDRIAQGGMAEVYKVKSVGIAGFEKVQALKRILPHSAREARFIRSFIDEARIAVELTHRNIVQVFDFGRADGELFMAMELIEGRDLRAAMAQAATMDLPWPTEIAAYVIGEVAAGLDYAHRKTDGYGEALGIVHCDVSPSNVMLSTDGSVKILDFGIARATFSSAIERRRLRGKPRYMAPEQTRGESPTAASDVFALGIIAWELFTGMPLYRGPDIKAILEAVRRMDPPRIDRLNPSVPGEIVDAVAIALRRDPGARGAASDLAMAMARTAMRAGARPLARWLRDLDHRATTSEPASRNLAGPALAPSRRDSQPAMDAPPLRPSTRSLTASLLNLPGAPGFGETLTTSRTAARYAPQASAAASELASGPVGRPSTTGLGLHTFGDRDPTASVTGTRPFEVAEPSATAPSSAFDVGATGTGSAGDAPRWGGHETTSAGVGRLADAFSAFEPAGSGAFSADAVTPPYRPRAYEALVPMPGIDPASLRFDDEVTQLGAVAPAVDDATGHHDLVLEIGGAPSADGPPAIGDRIDDDPRGFGADAIGERRRAVVVAGVVEGGPPEAARALARSVGELAYQRGGVVLRLEDDALYVAFGLEVAGEDDVAVAMGWALDASALARDAAPADPGAPELALRLGARTGVSTEGAATRPDPSQRTEDAGASIELGSVRISGAALDETRALARDATPGRPLFVGGADRITSGLYVLRELSVTRRVRRGKVYEVLGPRSASERDSWEQESRGAFVGRQAQLGELEELLQRAIDADRRLTVLVSGAAGTGKSRLIAELRARRAAARAQLRTIYCTTNPATRGAPFSLVVDLFQAAIGGPRARGRAGRARLTHQVLRAMTERGVDETRARAVATDLDRAMELRDGLGVRAPEVADLRPRISAGLAIFRAAMADPQRPLLTIIEDVLVADTASLEVLRQTLATPASGAELLVLTARPEGPAPPPVDRVVGVGDLVGDELRALVTERLGEAASPSSVEAVIARAGGNPLLVEELAQAVREAGPDIPASARDVIAARVERLSPKAREALRCAAVLGTTLRRAIVEELVAMEASDETGAAGAIDQLLEAGMLVDRDPSAAGRDGELRFARGVVREVVYESMSARAQRDGHARVGRLLASRHLAGREEPPAVVAEHLERGGEHAAAAAFWLRAGRLALAAFDAASAAGHFSRTLQLEQALGAATVSATSLARRREAHAGREEAHRMLGDLVSHPDDLVELERLCAGDPRGLADVAIRRAHRLLRVGDHAGASMATAHAEDHAIAARSGRLRGEALRVRGEVLERIGRFDDALLVVGDAVELFAQEGHVDDEMAAMVGRGRIHLMRAHYEAARDAYRPVIARIATTGDPYLERVVQNHVAIIELCLGNYAAAMTSAARSVDLCRRYGDRSREGEAISVAGIVLHEVGRHDEAAARFDEALDILARTAARWSHADCLIYAGACEVARGRARGLDLLGEALAEARRLGARYLEANTLVTRAGAHLQRGELAKAIEDGDAGASVARGATLVGYEIQGLARHAAALARQGGAARIAEALPLVDQALALIAQQRYLEGSEEEVYAGCAVVLVAAGADDRARTVRARGRREVERKLAGLSDPSWQASYRARPAVAALLADP